MAKIKMVKLTDLKTYEAAIQKDEFLQSAYLELLKIEHLFDCLEDFIVQSKLMFNITIQKLSKNETADSVISAVEQMAASIEGYEPASIECLFFFRLIADKLEIQKEKWEFDLNMSSERFKSGAKKLKPNAEFLLGKLNAIFNRDIKYFPVNYEHHSNSIESIDRGQGANEKWWVWPKEIDAGNTTNNNENTTKSGQNSTVPIWWTGTGRQLGYLLEQLAQKGFIDKHTDINQAIKAHFQDKDKKPFTDSIKQNRSGAGNVNKSGKPKGANDIDGLVSDLSNQQ